MIEKSISLHCDTVESDGTIHDKVYHIQVVCESKGKYLLLAQWGKRTGKLRYENKFPEGVSRWKAELEFHKLVRKQMDKGYHTIQTDQKVLAVVSLTY